jgi:hypothetical protein
LLFRAPRSALRAWSRRWCGEVDFRKLSASGPTQHALEIALLAQCGGAGCATDDVRLECPIVGFVEQSEKVIEHLGPTVFT